MSQNVIAPMSDILKLVCFFRPLTGKYGVCNRSPKQTETGNSYTTEVILGRKYMYKWFSFV